MVFPSLSDLKSNLDNIRSRMETEDITKDLILEERQTYQSMKKDMENEEASW
jgi:hypothetical protein